MKGVQIVFYFDQSRCIGCHTCAIACMDWHNLEVETNWRKVTTEERGKFPNLFVSHLSLSCCHCANPICATVCPVNAITKREEDGIVVVDGEKCLGKNDCGIACKNACPYSSPQFGTEENAKMQKCDLCMDRWGENKRPICVEACPMRALDAGPLDVLKTKYGNIKEAAGFVYSTKTQPSTIFNPKTPVKAKVASA